ncbi:nuclear transport factor 2 family protein [Actinomadura graeca]|uniref:Nuclear transport factor 2 family protein n=1 Tax=Actinomadura graeca TaxID=2750812 RepID=A0ABX8R2T8_9ACTN|nr:nuclear transport factor 2 family protein [Actinomadura graeca]QXJ25355.1 nuclear transport factor 2 family protein [Actinomadura graeca]
MATGTAEEQQVRTAGERWADAERRMDTGALADLLDEDFRGVGPVGFVLTKEQWLARYEGGLSITGFDWRDVGVRVFGATAVAIGTQVQEATYQDHPSSGRFRVTQVLVRRDGAWRVAGVHLSPQQAP